MAHGTANEALSTVFVIFKKMFLFQYLKIDKIEWHKSNYLPLCKSNNLNLSLVWSLDIQTLTYINLSTKPTTTTSTTTSKG